MGFFAFKDIKDGTKKENLTGKVKNIMPAEISPDEIRTALAADGMFFCRHYLCSMQERHCIEYQKQAIQGCRPGQTSLYRPECGNCVSGRAIAEKHQITLPKKKTEKKCRGCGKMLPLSEFYSEDIRKKYSARCIGCMAEYNREYNSGTDEVFA